MTPLIDAVLLLLIFFALSSSYVVQPGITVNLPEASARALDKPQEITVLVRPDGALFFDGKPVSLGELRSLLKSRVANQAPGTIGTALIQADKNVPHGLVVQVMDVAQTAGLKLAIGTTPGTSAGTTAGSTSGAPGSESAPGPAPSASGGGEVAP